jgi:predicted porin
MKKSLIALAVAAALPVAAQADVTLSGSVAVKINEGSKVDTDASMVVSIEEQLANGMTAKANFEVMSGDATFASESNGTASLSGDFGTLTAGTIDSDSAFQAGDVAEVVANTENFDEEDTMVQGFHLSTGVAGLTLQLQRNASTRATGIFNADNAATNDYYTVTDNVSATGTKVSKPAAVVDSTQFGISYDLNGLAVGASYTSADADAHYDTGVNKATSAYGMSYSFGDMTVKVGKQEEDKAHATVTYVAAMDAFTVEATAKTKGYDIVGTYNLDGVVLKATAEKTNNVKKDVLLEASYTTGELTFTADSNDKMTAALDMGNADLTLERENNTDKTKKITSLTYKVSF